MKRFLLFPALLLGLVAVPLATPPAHAAKLNLKRAVPDDVFLLVYAKHNPERDFQQAYYEEIWKAVQETDLINKVVKIVTSQLDDEQISGAKGVLEELRQAADPIDLEALSNCKEMVYAQRMQVPSANHLMVARLTPDDAASTVKGLTKHRAEN